MVLILDTDTLQRIRTHAEQTYPEECCGILVGLGSCQAEDLGCRSVVEATPVENSWDAEAAAIVDSLTSTQSSEPTHPKRDRYWVDPKTLLTVQRTARDRNLDIVGIYHSHPDNPAVPSECDRTLAWSGYSYIIVSVVQGQATDVRSWCLDETHQFQAEVMRMGAQPPQNISLQ
ncbi:MAG TPA: M67 family metallopeptidase [Leptolyngbyaceae cyanobacterium]